MKTNTEISFSFWLTLFYSIPLLALTDRRTEEHTRFAWARGTFFPVVLYVVSAFGSGRKKVLVQIRMYYMEMKPGPRELTFRKNLDLRVRT